MPAIWKNDMYRTWPVQIKRQQRIAQNYIHFGPRSLRSFLKVRSDQGPNCLNHALRHSGPICPSFARTELTSDDWRHCRVYSLRPRRKNAEFQLSSSTINVILLSDKKVRKRQRKSTVHNVTAITPFKVIQGHRFWYQSKAPIRLPISD